MQQSSVPSTRVMPSSAALDFLKQPHQLLIGDRWVDGGAEPIAVENPARAEHIADVSAASDADLDAAVASARAALDGPWGRMSGRDRAAVLFRFADLLDANADLIGEVMTLDSGLPKTVSIMAVRTLAADVIRYYAGWATKITGDAFEPSLGGSRAHLDFVAMTLREPIGVVGAIVPWNAPAGMITLKVAPALAAGCTMVLKTAELAPLTGEFFGRLLLEAGAPAGTLNIVHGRGIETGAAMAAHPGIDKIAFTGSTEVGRSIVKAATGNLKKVTLELGGKSPMVVFPDADLGKVVPQASMACYVNSGQACMAGTRLFVHADVYDEVTAGIAAFSDDLAVGDGLEPGTVLGPLISARQKERVEGYIALGESEGATRISGKADVAGDGYFVRPTLFVDGTSDMSIAKQEIFGPVLTAIRFTDEEAVLAEINSTQYGLSGSVWTQDVGRAVSMARKIDSGQVGINVHAAVSPETPFGGNRQSGWGREFGEEGLAAYLKTKAITINLGAR